MSLELIRSLTGELPELVENDFHSLMVRLTDK